MTGNAPTDSKIVLDISPAVVAFLVIVRNDPLGKFSRDYLDFG